MKSYALYVSALAMILSITGCFCQSCDCGRAPLNTAMVGGQNASAGSWPWHVRIVAFMENGGSLISADWVLTAAHTVTGTDPSLVTVYLGSVSRTVSNPHQVISSVSQIITHPNFSSVYNDIALLRLSSPVTFSDYISPVCLAAAGSIFVAGTESWIAGWGVLQATAHQPPDVFQEVEVSVLDSIACNSVVHGQLSISMMCTAEANGEGPCLCDDGSALVIKQNSQWIQAGIYIVSGCGLPGYPAVYTRVSEYEDWINSQITSEEPEFIVYPNNDFILNPHANRVSSWTLHPSFIVLPLLLRGLFS